MRGFFFRGPGASGPKIRTRRVEGCLAVQSEIATAVTEQNSKVKLLGHRPDSRAVATNQQSGSYTRLQAGNLLLRLRPRKVTPRRRTELLPEALRLDPR